jgi:hypothetical protein
VTPYFLIRDEASEKGGFIREGSSGRVHHSNNFKDKNFKDKDIRPMSKTIVLLVHLRFDDLPDTFESKP